MIRRISFALFLAFATLSLSGVAFFTRPPFVPTAGGAVCSDTSLHTITTVGTGNLTTPSGCSHVTVKVIGSGASGACALLTSGPGGGGGAASAQSGLIAVTPLTTVVFYDIFAGGAAVTCTGTGMVGNPGAGLNWINVGTNAAPASAAVGVVADKGLGGGGGSGGAGGLTANSIGATTFAGGAGFSAASVYGGGGGSGGDAGAGTAATSATGGAGGSPNGGHGGNGGATGGGGGAAPGAGGGATVSSATHITGAGAAGQVEIQFSAFLDLQPANDNCALAALAA